MWKLKRHFLVWNRVRIWRTWRHTPCKSFLEYPPGMIRTKLFLVWLNLRLTFKDYHRETEIEKQLDFWHKTCKAKQAWEGCVTATVCASYVHPVGIPRNSWWGCAVRFSKSWSYFRPKNVIFHTRFSDPASKIHTRFQTCSLRNYVVITQIREPTLWKNFLWSISNLHVTFSFVFIRSFPIPDQNIYTFPTVKPALPLLFYIFTCCWLDSLLGSGPSFL